jgi:hypothetical protein
MVAARPTGIEAVDRELKRRKFPDAETAEMVANQLLAVWRALTSGSARDTYVIRTRRRKQSDQR